MELSEEIDRFDSWAQPIVGRRGGREWVWKNSRWEVDAWQRDYPRWEALYDAVRAVLDGPNHLINAGDVLHVIAWDTNDERVMGMLVKREEALYSIAEYLVDNRRDYIYRVAIALEQVGGPRAEHLLKAFFPNNEEYIGRRRINARIVATKYK